MTTASATPNAPKQKAAGKRLSGGDFLERYGVILALLAIILLFSVLRPETFPTSSNIRNILNQTAVLIVLSSGLTVALVLGDFDLSIGNIASLAGVLAGVLMVTEGWSIWLAIVAIIASGAAIGFANGLLVTKVRINAFIATLGMGSIVTGLSRGANEGALVSSLPYDFLDLVSGDIGPVPKIVVLSLGIALICWYLLEKTVAGRQMYAIGENQEAARLAGVPVDRLRIVGFVISGLLAAIAGLLLTARSGASAPDAAVGLLLPAYAAAFLGASTLKPGEFHIGGTIIGVLLSAVTVTGLTMMNVAFWVSYIVQGGILLIAVGLARRH